MLFIDTVLPTDGKPVSDFTNTDHAWNDVYDGLKKVIEEETNIRQLKITQQFSVFLQNSELLAHAHAQKDSVLLSDIFVYPEVLKYDDSGEYEKKISSDKLPDSLLDHPKILVAGEDRSGKTSLCKTLFIELRKRDYVPVYIHIRPNGACQ